MKRYLDFLLPALVVIIKLIVSILSLPYDIDSLYDEGFLILTLHDATNGAVGGSSLWPNILVALLGERICFSMLSLRIADAVLSIASGLLFWMITSPKVAKGRLSSMAYLVLILFVLSPICGIILSYNGISRFMLLLVCAASFRLFYDDEKRHGLWAVLIGFALIMAFFSILPSSIMVGGAVCVLFIIRFWKQWRKMLKLFGMLVLGAVAAFLIVHFFVADLKEVYMGMSETAKTITKVNRGYDPISFCVKILLFFRDISFFLLTSIGIFWVSFFLKRNGYSWLASLFFITAILLYWHYQEKPKMSFGMQMSVIWLLPLFNKWCDKQLPSLRQLFSFDNAFNLFLCFFPVLAVIGTNLPLGVKIGWFILPWALLAWRLGFDGDNKLFRWELLLAISFVLFLGSFRQMARIDSTQAIVNQGPLKGMRLNSAQEKHFIEVGQILEDYHYQRGKSVVFSTQLSMATLCYFESVPCGLFFQPTDFIAHASDNLPVPDFLFLCEFDELMADEALKNMPWGWPEDYDKFYVGTPETKDPGYPTERWLYCRKSLIE
jgi:hypothetical protein